ncbi:unnamed protein product [Prunus armeniaca]
MPKLGKVFQGKPGGRSRVWWPEPCVRERKKVVARLERDLGEFVLLVEERSRRASQSKSSTRRQLWWGMFAQMDRLLPIIAGLGWSMLGLVRCRPRQLSGYPEEVGGLPPA